MKDVATAATCALFAVATLAGCAADISVNSYRGAPPPSSSIDELGAPSAIWIGANAEKIAITTWGSSSCSAYPTSVSASEENVIDVTIALGGGPACTADMSAHTFEVTTPEKPDPTQEVTVNLSDGGKGPVTAIKVTPIGGG